MTLWRENPMFEDQRPTNGSANVAGDERRAAQRHPCDLVPFWTEWGTGRGESPLAQVNDISAGGISLLTPCRVQPGKVLVIKLFSEHQGMSRPLLVRVIHCTQQPNGVWLSGSSFVRRLTLEDLEAILHEGSKQPPDPE